MAASPWGSRGGAAGGDGDGDRDASEGRQIRGGGAAGRTAALRSRLQQMKERWAATATVIRGRSEEWRTERPCARVAADEERRASGIAMECLTAIFAVRNVGREYNFVCPSKPAGEKQCIPGRVLCYFTAHTNSSQCCKVATGVCPISPVVGRRSRWRSFAASLNLENGPAPSSSTPSSSGQTNEQLTSDELKSLLADKERSKLLRKLSEANQQNRFLKRQSQIKDDAVVKFRSELAVLELELQALVGLAEEIANFDVPSGSRKVNGKYIQSHLLSRLEAVHAKVMVQIKDIEYLRPREIAVHWVGMAENVQIMGSFDGWSHGEAMSREYSGDYARFSATLRLRPGSYEIKFLVDGKWKLSSEYPITGEGLTQNNKLVVE